MWQSDVQGLAHAVELSRQGAVDSLRFTGGNLMAAFKVGTAFCFSWDFINNLFIL